MKAINVSLYFTVVIVFFFCSIHYKVDFVTNSSFNYLHGMSSHNSFERENSIRMPLWMACEVLISLLCLDASMNFLTFHDVTCSIVSRRSELWNQPRNVCFRDAALMSHCRFLEDLTIAIKDKQKKSHFMTTLTIFNSVEILKWATNIITDFVFNPIQPTI